MCIMYIVGLREYSDTLLGAVGSPGGITAVPLSLTIYTACSPWNTSAGVRYPKA